MEHRCLLVISLAFRKHTGTVERLSAKGRCLVIRGGKGPLQPSTPLGQVAAGPPEAPERSGYPQSGFGITALPQPTKCSAQVVVLALQPVQPGNLVWSIQLRF